MKKTALICGISGQDGSYLAEFLIKKGYQVFGTSRDAQSSSFQNLVRLGIRDQVELESMSLIEFRSVLQILTKIQPDEIYNLASQSSVGLSFEQPVETLEGIMIGTLNLLEAIRFTGTDIKLYNAASSECFGNVTGGMADENTPFRPQSPYAVAKAAAFWEVANYREAYGLFACSGILYNHESPLRPERFVTQKIVIAACRIASFHQQEKLHLGNVSIKRDWGWAPEYVEAMYLMLQQSKPNDYVISTGESYSLEAFVESVFSEVDLNWQEHVVTDASLYRATDIAECRGNPAKALSDLGWQATFKMPDVAKMMVKARKRSPNFSLANPS
ncbi:MAG: GDP-mannose 4,6 dehydratase [Candidatus Parabeggiatoa sp. nov. 1]|nr:MAG: GDP-mannose 4,6 dehydratase [Gammaproteobacteria bacterium]